MSVDELFQQQNSPALAMQLRPHMVCEVRLRRRCWNVGTWCPQCRAIGKRPGIAVADDIASAKGGRCLSVAYEHSLKPIHFVCRNGHKWMASLSSVKHGGNWCRQCYLETITSCSFRSARVIAESRGGRCLSTEYLNSKTPLDWECGGGHRWKATYRNVKSGTWCSECATGKSEAEVRRILECIFQGMRFPRRRPGFLKGLNGHNLELDGYCTDLGLAFEFNGQQHYDPNIYFNRLEQGRFTRTVARDRLKESLCRDAGVRLVVVPYFVPDRWTFIRASLIGWFCLREIFPTMIEE